MNKIKQVAVIGKGGEINEELKKIAKELGEKLVENNCRIICGGRDGIMKEVCKGAKKAKKYREGMTVGILPTTKKETANEYVDIVIPTGMSYARNQIIVLSADVVVGIGGGAGTLSEIAMAWQYGKKIILIEKSGGWSEKIAKEEKIDEKEREKIIRVKEVEEAIEIIRKI
ncbi:MAG: TIGR00725 family protein [Candidatus Heimdallarchaeum endolithica]|uniref:TIGR00725 family protein n=1 Tax=Candidatus Heimdallarchaeum endolithica TaxID=2876572 RepID=A0A9Y1BTL5_9ARCH|nr:MAG: TIGR00725 family protein [Candidatus Heimdallarchaeum endolithica]